MSQLRNISALQSQKQRKKIMQKIIVTWRIPIYLKHDTMKNIVFICNRDAGDERTIETEAG